MVKEEATGGQSDASGDQSPTKKKRSRSKRKELGLRSRRRGPASPGNNSNDEQFGDTHKPKSRQSRQQSEAEKRNQVEKQRKIRHDAGGRDAPTNNRFLRAISGQRAATGKADPIEAKERDDKGDDDDDDTADTTTSLLKKREAAPSVKSTEGIIVTPAALYSGWFQCQSHFPAAKRWTQQLIQQEEAGLFVEEERKQFHRLEHSTLDRLEERLHRELFTPAQREKRQVLP